MATKNVIPGLGKRIVAAYQAVGLNRSQAVHALGSAYTTVTNWENEESVPDAHYILKLSQLSGVNAHWLLTGEGPVYADESRRDAPDPAEQLRIERDRAVVNEYLASDLAVSISPEVERLLREFDFSSVGSEPPTVKTVHRLRDLIELQLASGHS